MIRCKALARWSNGWSNGRDYMQRALQHGHHANSNQSNGLKVIQKSKHQANSTQLRHPVSQMADLKFSELCLQEASTTVSTILTHPFNEHLMKGTLNESTFKWFLQQDSLYLNDYARALLILASRVEDVDVMLQLIYFANETLTTEKDMHKDYYKKYNIEPTREKCYTCSGYGNFLIATCHLSSVCEAFAAMFPCFIVFDKVGRKIVKGADMATNPYKEWISLYTGDWMEKNLTAMSKIVDGYYTKAGLLEKRSMIEMFKKAVTFELAFWNGIYNPGALG